MKTIYPAAAASSSPVRVFLVAFGDLAMLAFLSTGFLSVLLLSFHKVFTSSLFLDAGGSNTWAS